MRYDTSKYPAYWPKYQPYGYSITRSTTAPVPNRNSIDWPQAQTACPYLPPGSPSFQPYRYPAPGPWPNIDGALYVNEYDALSGAGCGCSGYGDAGCSCGCGGACGAKKNTGYTATDGIRMGVSLLAAWVIGPMLLKTQFPKWGYGQRALTSWAAVTVVNLAWNASQKPKTETK